MYHFGKVLRVFRPADKDIAAADSSVQASVLMWDENLLTVSVEPILGEKIKDNDIVIVDYSPLYSTIPVLKQTIIKIVRGELAKKVWKDFEEYRKKKRDESEPPLVQGHNVR